MLGVLFFSFGLFWFKTEDESGSEDDSEDDDDSEDEALPAVGRPGGGGGIANGGGGGGGGRSSLAEVRFFSHSRKTVTTLKRAGIYRCDCLW